MHDLEDAFAAASVNCNSGGGDDDPLVCSAEDHAHEEEEEEAAATPADGESAVAMWGLAGILVGAATLI